MRMDGMHHEDQDNQRLLDATVNRDKLREEADVVLEGKADDPHQNYEVTKPEGGFNGLEMITDPYKFANENFDKAVLIIHGDGSFERFNHTTDKPQATAPTTPESDKKEEGTGGESSGGGSQQTE